MNNLIYKLSQFKQFEIIEHLNQLSEIDKETLSKDISTSNYELALNLFHNYKDNDNKIFNNIKPIAYDEVNDKESLNKYLTLGLDSISSGKIAIVLLAGGQGTRLGHNGPKGTFKVGLPSNRSLFEVQADQIANLKKQTGVNIPWLIMTSEDNHQETVEFFNANGNFGLDDNEVHFFMQNELPIISSDGNLILKSDTELLKGPDGNGGVYILLQESKLLDYLKNLGVEWIFFYGVDNLLVKIADPVFLGYTISKECSISSKSVKRLNKNENVGVFCVVDNKPAVIEYSEVEKIKDFSNNDETSIEQFTEANIMNHFVSINAINKIISSESKYHVAKKEYEVKGANGKSTKVIGYKFEQFIFDPFSNFESMPVLRVNRDNEFAPVKNKVGKDSPEEALLKATKAGIK